MNVPTRSPSRSVQFRLNPGDKIGDWTVTSEPVMARCGGKDRTHYRCACACGTERLVLAQALKSGASQGCGCDTERKGRGGRKHGESLTVLYQRWQAMKSRCEYPGNKHFDRYGGRGIRVCPEWATYEPFRAWAQEHGYRPNLQLDRMDNDGHYTPENCRWTTQWVQKNNRCNTLYVTAFNETKPAKDWVEDPRCVVRYTTLASRITRYGWTHEDALTVPAIRGGERVSRRVA